MTLTNDEMRRREAQIKAVSSAALRAFILEAHAAIREKDQRYKDVLMCDVCAGTGKVESGECACGGSGLLLDAFNYTRRLLTKIEREITRELKSIYGTWHACALSVKDAKSMKLPNGRLCDDCLEMIRCHVADIMDRIGDADD